MLKYGSACAATAVPRARACGQVTSTASARLNTVATPSSDRGTWTAPEPRTLNLERTRHLNLNLTALASTPSQQVVHRLCERNLGSPSELVAQSRGVADHERRVVRAVARLVHPDAHRHARTRDQHVEQVADDDRVSRAHVVGAPRLAPLHDGAIGTHGVADVGQVAAGLEVAHGDLGLPSARLDVRDPPGESSRDEERVLTRSEMVEGAGDRGGRTVGIGRADHLLRQLAEGVGAGRHERILFGERPRCGRVDHRRAHHQDARRGAAPPQPIQQMVCPAHVDAEGRIASSATSVRRARRRRSDTPATA